MYIQREKKNNSHAGFAPHRHAAMEYARLRQDRTVLSSDVIFTGNLYYFNVINECVRQF